MLIYRGMNKENVVYTYNGILFSLEKGHSQYVTAWVNLEDMMLSEISQSQKDRCCMVPLIRST